MRQRYSKLPLWQNVLAWTICIVGIAAVIAFGIFLQTFRWGYCP